MTELKQRRVSRLGWVPDLPDARDHRFSLTRATNLPKSADLRPGLPAVYDQGALGSCTGNAIAAAIQFDRMKQGVAPDFIPSRLFIYYNERAIEGTIRQDAGAMIRDGIKSVAKLGVCPEAGWPYDVSKFTRKPPAKAFADALAHTVASYQRLVSTDLTALRACLAAGFPFVFGFSVYEAFESDTVARTGVLQMPARGEAQLGGHAVLAVGYDDATKRFLVRNSWGPAWGQHGYFTIPYDYLTNTDLADDFWTIRTVST